MYEFIQTATGWQVYWGPPPREVSRAQAAARPAAPALRVQAPEAARPAPAAAEGLALISRA
jgi:hypothetical protein